ncbi:hypothetical protein [Microbacterium thalassium]|uniref:Uncharacterized protein n=1 Tax=Microbacterium thalassium TaxID=362649 RepID=A0A7X0FNM2_9MICO|nr:hypothetical protein [Microbacterium thalassium]MBB6390819.1 hypothetical protein [Microbacterium thalassium]GLK25927.1 hypothetical protein GCM10017607_32460 [Microbacterium thalassium]
MSHGITADLRSEMMRRMDDGWHLDGDRRDDEMWMIHLVHPPAWRFLLEFLNPLSWFLSPDHPTAQRRLHVWVDEAGVLHRRTTGEIPPRWRQHHSWEVPDGPIPN